MCECVCERKIDVVHVVLHLLPSAHTAHIHGYTNRRTDRQTNRHIDRKDRQTDRQIDRHVDRHADRQKYR